MDKLTANQMGLGCWILNSPGDGSLNLGLGFWSGIISQDKDLQPRNVSVLSTRGWGVANHYGKMTPDKSQNSLSLDLVHGIDLDEMLASSFSIKEETQCSLSHITRSEHQAFLNIFLLLVVTLCTLMTPLVLAGKPQQNPTTTHPPRRGTLVTVPSPIDFRGIDALSHGGRDNPIFIAHSQLQDFVARVLYTELSQEYFNDIVSLPEYEFTQEVNGFAEEDEDDSEAVLEEQAAEALRRLLDVIQGARTKVQQRDYLKYTLNKNGNLSYIYLANNQARKASLVN
ncbi:hypothetical protein CAPTEDRAFT_218053 [Capitella teleta]|uniref:Uncharacterized protein n=1 Tax=Capitella teleta TaxID=283909 RepID=R7TYW1_CAPTE|nr:hypothetical protein CAPTEDRAFT_218053 [Capitella teleta]|eukprot:ELT98924.1 hypothetical protein CAPTEDRAFT_218053 [Capitella teleta]